VFFLLERRCATSCTLWKGDFIPRKPFVLCLRLVFLVVMKSSCSQSTEVATPWNRQLTTDTQTVTCQRKTERKSWQKITVCWVVSGMRFHVAITWWLDFPLVIAHKQTASPSVAWDRRLKLAVVCVKENRNLVIAKSSLYFSFVFLLWRKRKIIARDLDQRFSACRWSSLAFFLFPKDEREQRGLTSDYKRFPLPSSCAGYAKLWFEDEEIKHL